MNIKIEGRLNSNTDVVKQLLEIRGLDENWLTADETYLNDGTLMRNFQAGYDLLEKHKNNNVIILIDNDTDGITSAATIYQWLSATYPNMNLDYKIAEGKTHGIIFPILPDSSEYQLLIIPDASSSEVDKHKILAEQGIDILILDHHEISQLDNPYAVVINPHHPECPYPNKTLSGVGVVYKFIEAIDKLNGVDNHTKYLDLVATGLVADVMSMRDLENKALINLGVAQINNPYIKAYLKADGRIKDKPFTPTIVGFYLAPQINALIRMGTTEDKIELFKAMIGEIDAEYVVASIISIKRKQDGAKEPIVTRIVMDLQKSGRDKNKVILAEVPKRTPSALTGLIAGQLASLYQKPVLLGRVNDDGNFVGSARSINGSSVADLKDFSEASGLFNFVAGHQAAHGLSIPADKVEEYLEYAEANLPKFEKFYSVFICEGDKSAVIAQLENLDSHYGPGFEEILLYDELYLMPGMAQIIGAKNNTLRIQTDELTYIKFRHKGDIPQDNKMLKIVGKPNMNYFNGMATAQIFLEDWEEGDLVL